MAFSPESHFGLLSGTGHWGDPVVQALAKELWSRRENRIWGVFNVELKRWSDLQGPSYERGMDGIGDYSDGLVWPGNARPDRGVIMRP